MNNKDIADRAEKHMILAIILLISSAIMIVAGMLINSLVIVLAACLCIVINGLLYATNYHIHNNATKDDDK